MTNLLPRLTTDQTETLAECEANRKAAWKQFYEEKKKREEAEAQWKAWAEEAEMWKKAAMRRGEDGVSDDMVIAMLLANLRARKTLQDAGFIVQADEVVTTSTRAQKHLEKFLDWNRDRCDALGAKLADLLLEHSSLREVDIRPGPTVD